MPNRPTIARKAMPSLSDMRKMTSAPDDYFLKTVSPKAAAIKVADTGCLVNLRCSCMH